MRKNENDRDGNFLPVNGLLGRNDGNRLKNQLSVTRIKYNSCIF